MNQYYLLLNEQNLLWNERRIRMKEKIEVKEFGKALKKGRIRMGLTQRQLGKLVGLSNTYISNLEKGRGYPSVLALLRILCVFYA